MENDNRTIIIQKAVDEIEKRYGKGTVMNFETDHLEGVEFSSTGSIGLDIAMGGGFAKGRIIEIFGPESSGKSTLCIHAIAEIQAADGVAAYIDTEHSFDRFYAEKLGVKFNKEQWLFSQPDNGEQALEIAEILIRTGKLDIIVVDSVAALVPKAEIDGEMGDSKMGLQARLMSQAMRKLAGIISKSNTLAIFTNQLREKIGVVFGNPEVTPGGTALKFYASQRLDIRRIIAQNKDADGNAVSSRVKVKVIKNKVAPPFKMAEFDIVFGLGIDKLSEIIDISSDLGVIKKSGSWFSYGETKLGQGKEAVKKILEDNPELLEEITTITKNKLL